MDRLKEYCSFAVRFAGLGYLPFWPLTSSGPGGDLFGGALMCGDTPAAPLELFDWICRAPHPLTLSPALHVLGAASACYVGLRLAYCGCRRLRRRRTAVTEVRIPEGLMIPTRPRAPVPPLSRPVMPRNHFGLRGMKAAPDMQDMA